MEPTSTSIAAGETVQFHAVATDLYGNEASTAGLTWSATGGKISSSGLFTPDPDASVCSVTVTLGSISGRATVTAKAAPKPAQVLIEPSTISMATSETLQFRAVVLDASGNPMLSTVVWSSTGGSVTQSGFFTPDSAAEAGLVVATVGTGAAAVSGKASITIRPIAAPGRSVQMERILSELKAASSTYGRPSSSWSHRGDVVDTLLADIRKANRDLSEADALALIDDAISGNSERMTVLALDVLATVKLRTGRHEEAKAILEKRLNLNATTKGVYESLLKLRRDLGELEEFDTYVHGRRVQFDVRPLVKNGRTLVPLRAMVEAPGADVVWNPANQTVTVSKGDTVLRLRIGESVALVNGREVSLDSSAELDGGRTLVPLRFISESFGLSVTWIAEHRTIAVTETPLE